MKRRMLGSILVVVLVGTLIGVPGRASASEHLMLIDEVFGGVTYSTNAHFVELRMWTSGQNFVDDSQLTTFNAGGAELQDIDLSSNVLSGDAGDSILIATETAEELFGLQADFEQTSISLGVAGRACFGPDESTNFYDCVTWGNYTGPSPQDPVNDPEGMIDGASFRRTYGSNGIDGSDDHDNNQRDFILDTPAPRSNNGDTGEVNQRVKFGGTSFTAQEDALATHEIPLSRLGDTTGAVDVFFSLTNGTSEGNDYMPADGIVTFGNGVNHIDVGVNVVNNDTFEGRETVKMSIRGPSSPAFLAAPMNATLTILDFEDDTDPPTSRVTKPDHGSAHKASRLDVMKGRAGDGVGLIDEVDVALRQKRTDGSCRWFNGNRFVRRPCSDKKFISTITAPDGDWRRQLDDPLPKSKGTKVKFYTVYSRAIDAGEPANTETSFTKGRNANKFEVT